MSIASRVGETSWSRFLRVGEPTSVVREHPLPNGSGSGDPDLQKERDLVHERWRGTGPRPTGKGDVL